MGLRETQCRSPNEYLEKTGPTLEVWEERKGKKGRPPYDGRLLRTVLMFGIYICLFIFYFEKLNTIMLRKCNQASVGVLLCSAGRPIIVKLVKFRQYRWYHSYKAFSSSVSFFCISFHKLKIWKWRWFLIGF